MSAKLVTCAAAVVLAAAVVPAAQGVPDDQKAVSVSICEPYAPDTTAAELQVSQNGIYNPGTTIEKVICPLPRDQEDFYTSGGLVIGVYYRVLGAAPGRLTCTVFIGSTGMHADPVLTSTLSGPLVSAGTRQVMWMQAGPQTGGNTVTPNTLICAISPKTQLAGIYFEEFGVTDYVDPPA